MPRPLHSGGWRALLNKRGDVYVPITSPLDIPGVGAYWSGAEANSEGYVNGQALVQLNDYSGNSNPWTQANAARRGTWRAAAYNGQGAVRLDNIDDGYIATYDPGAPPTPGTMAVLYAPTASLSTVQKHIAGTGGGAGNEFRLYNIQNSASFLSGPILTDLITYVIGNTGTAAGDALIPVGSVSAYSTTQMDHWINGIHNPTYSITHTPRKINLGYEISATPAQADILEVIVWTRPLEQDEIEDLFIYWYLIFNLNEAYIENFSNPDNRTNLNGYKEPIGSFYKLPDHDWTQSPWIVRDHYLKSYTDDAEGHTAGSNIDGLTATWGTQFSANATLGDIYNRVYGGNSDNRFRIKDALIVWPMPWGSNWNRVRLSLALACTDAGSAPAGLTHFFDFGVKAGGDASTFAHAVGWLTSETLGWGYSAGNYYLNRARVGKWENAIRTLGANQSNNWLAINPASKMCGVSVDITRGSPNFTIRTAPPYTTNPGPASLIEEELEGFSPLRAGLLNNTRYSPTSTDWLAEAIAVDEATYGTLDSFFIAWASTHFDIEISSIMIHRLD